jgi:hypothetical protein
MDIPDNAVSGDIVYVWGLQAEAGSFPTSYIPTEGSTVTRAADVASISGSNFSSWYNQSEGTVFYEGQVLGSDPTSNQDMLGVSDGTSSNAIEVFVPSGSYQRFKMSLGGVTQALQNIVGTPDVYQPVKAAYAFELDNTTSAGNGTVSGTDTSCSVPTVDRFTFGTPVTGEPELTARYKRLTYWPQRLPNNTLQTITQ